MKSSKLLLLLGLLFCGSLFGQVKIGDNPQAIDPGSVLELESAERVLVITRVSTAEMNAITPLQGALVYNTDLQCVHYFNGAAWVNLCGESGATANITADPIIHDIATIALTPSPNGTNIEIAENSISSEMIVNGGVNGVDIQNGSIGPGKLQNQSVTVDKLSQNAVGPFAINRDSLPVSFFENDIGYLTEINILSDAPENVLNIVNGGVFYDDTDLLNAVNGAEINLNNHIGDDNDLDAQNERITDLQLDENNMLNISEGGDVISTDLSPLLSGVGGGSNNTAFEVVSGNLEITDGGGTLQVPLTDLGISGTNQNAAEVPYDNTNSGLLASDAQAAIDEIAASGGSDDQNADEVPYTNTTSGLTATEVQAAIDELAATGGTDDQNADEVSYVNTTSGLTATEVQAAIDELAASGGSDDQNADEVPYTNTVSGLTATEVQAAIDELAASGGSDDQNADEVPYTNTTSGLTATEVQAAIDELAASGGSDDQQLTLETGNLLTLETGGTPIDLTPYLNTDAQTASLVPVSATPTNYTAATPDVEAHLAGIDATIGTIAVGNNLENTNLVQTDPDRTYNLSGGDLRFIGSGNIRMGTSTTAVTNKLHVEGTIRAEGIRNTFGTLPGSVAYSFNNDSNTGMYRSGVDQLGLVTGGIEALKIDASQNVGIGPTFNVNTIDARLHVQGSIIAEGQFYSNVNTIDPIPDFVFEKYFKGYSSLNEGYKFKSLADIEIFIKEHHHLPGITSAKEAKVAKKWDLTKSSLNNLEKIEELFLHTIEQEKKIDQLEAENKTISKELTILKKELETIKNLIENN